MRLGILAAALLTATAAQAGTIRVPEDYPSVLAAVDAAVSGDSVMVGPGTWTDTDTRVILIGGIPTTYTCAGFFFQGGVSVIGSGPGVTIIDAQETGTGRVVPFLFAGDPGEVLLEGMTITGCSRYGAGVLGFYAGKLIVRNCSVSGNDSPTSNGGIVVDTCDLLLEDSEVSANVGVNFTAGVSADFCGIEVRRCRFEGNQGRAIHLDNNLNKDDIVIEDCEFVENRMSIQGSACTVEDPLTVQIERNLFLGNVNTVGTGAGLWVERAYGTIQYNTFAYDSTYGGYPGAGVYCVDYTGTMTKNTFVGCHVDPPYNGSAAYLGTTGPTNLAFTDNLVVGCSGGGAIWLNYAPTVGCNGLWNNEGGLGDYVPDPTDLFLDPQFCDPAMLDFSLAKSSPYTAANNPTCGQIGALGEGCGPVSVEPETWGSIKAGYR